MSVRLTKSVVDRAKPEQWDYFLWDAELKGFGIKIAKGGRKSYVCKYRVGSGRSAPTRRMTIGAHGSPWTADQARVEARKILGRVA
ncbi:MAG: Arm DNA-binding domain-containing protein, partial [Hyphomicrobiales bacterium]|nr:Arm DNA-binding domain-containing protein [Hyphomicrobiales bacterium]